MAKLSLSEVSKKFHVDRRIGNLKDRVINPSLD